MSKYCPNCGAQNPDGANFCISCGYGFADGTQRQAAQPEDGYQQPYAQPQPRPQVFRVSELPRRSRIAAGVLYIILGDLGIGDFYLNRIGAGIAALLFCWTGIPAIIGLVKGIVILSGSRASFERKYDVIAED